MKNDKPSKLSLGFIFKMAGLNVALQRLFVQHLTENIKQC